MRRPLFTSLLLLTALHGTQAAATPNVALLKFTGPKAQQARAALAAVVCERVKCVAPERLTKRLGADGNKTGARAVSVMVLGATTRSAGRVELSIEILADGQASDRQKVELPKDGLAAETVAALAERVFLAAGVPTQQAEPPQPEVEPAPVEEKPAPKVPQVAQPVEPPLPAPSEDRYSFAGELGVNAANRSFDYLGAKVPELRRYSLAVVALVSARVEWFPFVSNEGRERCLGVELAGNVAPWIRSAPPNSTDSVPTFTARTDLALQCRVLPPLRGLSITPLLGVRFHSFAVTGTTPSGQKLDGLPNLAYVAMRAGVGAGYPIAGDRLAAFARVAVLPLVSAGELLSPKYFPKGWAMGIEVSGGVGLKVFSGVEVRLSVDWTRYMFWFDSSIVTSTYYARGAFDQYLGGNALVRIEL
jgi:hypothetical protein